MPACPEGMVLLNTWVDSNPSNVNQLQNIHRADLDTKEQDEDPLWRAYAEHVSTCPNCNETKVMHSCEAVV